MVQLGTSFVQTFRQFLAVRTLFGIAMGGVWGLASSTALENLPVEARGLGSGVLQQGYAIGYLISAVLNLYVVPHTRHTWRALFWTTSCLSALAAIIRAFIPESEVFLRAKEQERALGDSTEKKTKVFIHQVRVMLKTHWGLCLYAIMLMAGAFVWHTPGDVERTKMWDRFQLPFSWFPGSVPYLPPDDQRFRQIPFDRRNDHWQCRRYHVCLSRRLFFIRVHIHFLFPSGGAIAGSISQHIGRRLTIILFVTLSGVFIPLWILPSGFSTLAAGAFCVQFGVQGAWGVIPIQLAEMSPHGFRATFPGVAYQIGNVRGSVIYHEACELTDKRPFFSGLIDDIGCICADRGYRR